MRNLKDLAYWTWIAACIAWLLAFAEWPGQMGAILMGVALTLAHIWLAIPVRQGWWRRAMTYRYTMLVRHRLKTHCTSILPPVPDRPKPEPLGVDYSREESKDARIQFEPPAPPEPPKKLQGVYTLDELAEEFGDDAELSLGNQQFGTVKDKLENRR
jgi:hypothetical protein